MPKFQTFKVPFVAITKANAQIVNSQIQSSQIYGGGTGVNAAPKGRFIGSIAYWKNKLSANYCYNTILELVKAVNASNVTRVSANDMQDIAEYIWNNYKTSQDLENALSKDPFNVVNNVKSPSNNHILYKIAEYPFKKNNGGKYYLSFATKFCQFASKILNAGYEYSKYDKIVAENLPTYIKNYLSKKDLLSSDMGNRKMPKDRFLASDKKAKTAGGRDKMYTVLYAEYCDYIDRIIAKVNQGITREEFDHIVWYTNK